MLASFPNITHVDVQLMLAQGEWRYVAAGILDTTHLRFFTAHSFAEMALRYGFEVVRTEQVTIPPLATEVLDHGQRLRLSQDEVSLVDGLNRGNPHAHTYQFVVELKWSPTRTTDLRAEPVKKLVHADLPELDVILRTVPGRESYLKDALYSLVAVLGAKIRAIVVAHTDDVVYLERVRELASHFRYLLDDVHVVACTDGRGRRGRPLNVGLAESHAEFIAFLDDDDVLYPTFAQRLIGELRGDLGLTVAYGASQVVHGTVVHGVFQAVRKEPARALPFDRAALFLENYIPINSMVIRAGDIRGAGIRFDENLEVFEDWVFLCELAARFHFLAVDRVVSEYRLRDDGSNAVFGIEEAARSAARAAIEASLSGLGVTVSGAELERLAAGYKEREKHLIEEQRRLESQLAHLRGSLESVLGSRSWLLTKPLRRVLGSHLPERNT